jgi:hypothetical protein
MDWKKQREKRNKDIVKYRQKGLSFRKIGKLFGLSGEGARKAYQRAVDKPT